MKDLLKNVKAPNNFIKKDLKYSITRKSKNPAIKLELIKQVYNSAGLELPGINEVMGDKDWKGSKNNTCTQAIQIKWSRYKRRICRKPSKRGLHNRDKEI